jgi:transposase-like protein
VLQPISDTHTNTARNNGHASVASEILPAPTRPDPQVTQRATRRRFTAADKLRILAQAEACDQPGQLGALLRREGIYSSTLASFRKQRDAGKLGKDPRQVQQQRRDKEAARQRDARKIAHLQAENHKLKILIELQKKVAELMSLAQENPTSV